MVQPGQQPLSSSADHPASACVPHSMERVQGPRARGLWAALPQGVARGAGACADTGARLTHLVGLKRNNPKS
jgi:hypothetical protein